MSRLSNCLFSLNTFSADQWSDSLSEKSGVLWPQPQTRHWYPRPHHMVTGSDGVTNLPDATNPYTLQHIPKDELHRVPGKQFVVC